MGHVLCTLVLINPDSSARGVKHGEEYIKPADSIFDGRWRFAFGLCAQPVEYSRHDAVTELFPKLANRKAMMKLLESF
jgi:hypothetical protein